MVHIIQWSPLNVLLMTAIIMLTSVCWSLVSHVLPGSFLNKSLTSYFTISEVQWLPSSTDVCTETFATDLESKKSNTYGNAKYSNVVWGVSKRPTGVHKADKSTCSTARYHFRSQGRGKGEEMGVIEVYNCTPSLVDHSLICSTAETGWHSVTKRVKSNWVEMCEDTSR